MRKEGPTPTNGRSRLTHTAHSTPINPDISQFLPPQSVKYRTSKRTSTAIATLYALALAALHTFWHQLSVSFDGHHTGVQPCCLATRTYASRASLRV